jgi:hypothetical protein
VALDELNACRDEDRCGNIASVTSALATLCADDVDAKLEALLHVLGVSDHVHVEDAGAVELLDDSLGRNADGADEELCARVNDNVDELTELALCVVVAGRALLAFELDKT